VAAMGIAGIDAIHDGEMKRVEREAPTDSDFEALEKVLRERGSKRRRSKRCSTARLAIHHRDTKLCQAGLAYLDTLAAMPESARLRIYGFTVELMRDRDAPCSFRGCRVRSEQLRRTAALSLVFDR